MERCRAHGSERCPDTGLGPPGLRRAGRRLRRTSVLAWPKPCCGADSLRPAGEIGSRAPAKAQLLRDGPEVLRPGAPVERCRAHGSERCPDTGLGPPGLRRAGRRLRRTSVLAWPKPCCGADSLRPAGEIGSRAPAKAQLLRDGPEVLRPGAPVERRRAHGSVRRADRELNQMGPGGVPPGPMSVRNVFLSQGNQTARPCIYRVSGQGKTR